MSQFPVGQWRSRYSPRARVGWSVLAVIVLAGVYELLGLLVPELPGPPAPPGVSPTPSAARATAGPTVAPTAGTRPGTPSPAPGLTPPSPTAQVIIVQPQRGDRGPQGDPGQVIIVQPASPQPSRAATGPSSGPSPSPRPSACTVTVAGRCVVPAPAT